MKLVSLATLCLYGLCINCILECKTDSCTVESYTQEMNCLPADMPERPEFSVKSILEGNDKLTRFYTGHTGLPSYKCFIALVEYLKPKAVVLTPWNGGKTKEVSEKETQLISQTFARLTVADQLFSVLIRLSVRQHTADSLLLG